jgi:hypothetical protein
MSLSNSQKERDRLTRDLGRIIQALDKMHSRVVDGILVATSPDTIQRLVIASERITAAERSLTSAVEQIERVRS